MHNIIKYQTKICILWIDYYFYDGVNVMLFISIFFIHLFIKLLSTAGNAKKGDGDLFCNRKCARFFSTFIFYLKMFLFIFCKLLTRSVTMWHICCTWLICNRNLQTFNKVVNNLPNNLCCHFWLCKVCIIWHWGKLKRFKEKWLQQHWEDFMIQLVRCRRILSVLFGKYFNLGTVLNKITIIQSTIKRTWVKIALHTFRMPERCC